MNISDQSIAQIHERLQGSFFLYNLDEMAIHLQSLSIDGVRLWYACKANPLSAVLATVNEANLSFDVASLGELQQLIGLGVDSQKILLTGPVKQQQFLVRALEYGVEWFVLESPRQLARLQEMAARMDRKVNALIRLQLDWPQGEGSVLGGGEVSAFGMSPMDWGKVSSTANVAIRGVHVFQWGNVLVEEKLVVIWRRIADEAREFSKAQGFPLDVLDLGGGLGISYENPQERVDWDRLKSSFSELRRLSGAKEIWLELGRFAVGPFGSYVTAVEEIKTVKGEKFVLCNGGSHHLVRPALVKESFPARVLGKSSEQDEKMHVHGPLCTALDRLGTYDLPSDIREGDLLVFSQVGAYGFTESMPFFLCHELAGEVVWKNGDVRVAREVALPSFWLR